MTNGPHRHICSICLEAFYCLILVECYIDEAYAVCNEQACIDKWEAEHDAD